MIDHPTTKPFLQAMQQLLRAQKLVLYGRIDAVPQEEMQVVSLLLEVRFEHEASGYPGQFPNWNPVAASWAAKVVFHAAQLLLYRSHQADALTDFFPEFPYPKTAAAILSADLTLRYLPSILQQLEAIDVEDELIPILQEILRAWHYSGLLAGCSPESPNLDTVLGNTCLRQLYVDRIISTKNHEMATLPAFQGLVAAALGNHGDEYWKDLKLTL